MAAALFSRPLVSLAFLGAFFPLLGPGEGDMRTTSASEDGIISLAPL